MVFLDKKNAPDNYGYCVFGEVVDGIDIVDEIGMTNTGNKAGHQDVPLEAIIIEKAKQGGADLNYLGSGNNYKNKVFQDEEIEIKSTTLRQWEDGDKIFLEISSSIYVNSRVIIQDAETIVELSENE